jgi:hypothetical protein
MAAGSLMSWAKVSIHLPVIGMDESVSVAGTKGDGTITVVLAVVILILTAIAAFMAKGRWMGWIITACAVIATGVGVWDWTDIKSAGDEVIQGAQAATGGNEEAMKMLADGIKVSTGLGLYLVLLGGVLALIGGVMLATKKSPPPQMPIAPEMAPPPPLPPPPPPSPA